MALGLRDIQMRYPGSAAPSLDIPAWDVAAGDRIGLTGLAGAGKSSLADLLFALRPPSAGALLLDGVDARAIPVATLRRQVALVRHVELFPGSILDNVRLGREHLTYDDVARAVEAVGLLDELLTLPQGLDTPLHPHARPLTQRQGWRLMLARAIVGRPRLLVLDGALDQIEQREGDERLAATLFAPDAPWTLVCITDRPDVLARCGRVVTLRDGQLHGIGAETPVDQL